MIQRPQPVGSGSDGSSRNSQTPGEFLKESKNESNRMKVIGLVADER